MCISQVPSRSPDGIGHHCELIFPYPLIPPPPAPSFPGLFNRFLKVFGEGREDMIHSRKEANWCTNSKTDATSSPQKQSLAKNENGSQLGPSPLFADYLLSRHVASLFQHPRLSNLSLGPFDDSLIGLLVGQFFCLLVLSFR